MSQPLTAGIYGSFSITSLPKNSTIFPLSMNFSLSILMHHFEVVFLNAYEYTKRISTSVSLETITALVYLDSQLLHDCFRIMNQVFILLAITTGTSLISLK